MSQNVATDRKRFQWVTATYGKSVRHGCNKVAKEIMGQHLGQQNAW